MTNNFSFGSYFATEMHQKPTLEDVVPGYEASKTNISVFDVPYKRKYSTNFFSSKYTSQYQPFRYNKPNDTQDNYSIFSRQQNDSNQTTLTKKTEYVPKLNDKNEIVKPSDTFGKRRHRRAQYQEKISSNDYSKPKDSIPNSIPKTEQKPQEPSYASNKYDYNEKSTTKQTNYSTKPTKTSEYETRKSEPVYTSTTSETRRNDNIYNPTTSETRRNDNLYTPTTNTTSTNQSSQKRVSIIENKETYNSQQPTSIPKSSKVSSSSSHHTSASHSNSYKHQRSGTSPKTRKTSESIPSSSSSQKKDKPRASFVLPGDEEPEHIKEISPKKRKAKIRENPDFQVQSNNKDTSIPFSREAPRKMPTRKPPPLPIKIAYDDESSSSDSLKEDSPTAIARRFSERTNQQTTNAQLEQKQEITQKPQKEIITNEPIVAKDSDSRGSIIDGEASSEPLHEEDDSDTGDMFDPNKVLPQPQFPTGQKTQENKVENEEEEEEEEKEDIQKDVKQEEKPNKEQEKVEEEEEKSSSLSFEEQLEKDKKLLQQEAKHEEEEKKEDKQNVQSDEQQEHDNTNVKHPPVHISEFVKRFSLRGTTQTEKHHPLIPNTVVQKEEEEEEEEKHDSNKANISNEEQEKVEDHKEEEEKPQNQEEEEKHKESIIQKSQIQEEEEEEKSEEHPQINGSINVEEKSKEYSTNSSSISDSKVVEEENNEELIPNDKDDIQVSPLKAPENVHPVVTPIKIIDNGENKPSVQQNNLLEEEEEEEEEKYEQEKPAESTFDLESPQKTEDTSNITLNSTLDSKEQTSIVTNEDAKVSSNSVNDDDDSGILKELNNSEDEEDDDQSIKSLPTPIAQQESHEDDFEVDDLHRTDSEEKIVQKDEKHELDSILSSPQKDSTLPISNQIINEEEEEDEEEESTSVENANTNESVEEKTIVSELTDNSKPASSQEASEIKLSSISGNSANNESVETAKTQMTPFSDEEEEEEEEEENNQNENQNQEKPKLIEDMKERLNHINEIESDSSDEYDEEEQENSIANLSKDDIPQSEITELDQSTSQDKTENTQLSQLDDDDIEKDNNINSSIEDKSKSIDDENTSPQKDDDNQTNESINKGEEEEEKIDLTKTIRRGEFPQVTIPDSPEKSGDTLPSLLEEEEEEENGNIGFSPQKQNKKVDFDDFDEEDFEEEDLDEYSANDSSAMNQIHNDAIESIISAAVTPDPSSVIVIFERIADQLLEEHVAGLFRVQ